MTKLESTERLAITKIVSCKESTGYRRAVESKIPVTYLEKDGTIVCVNDGKKKVISKINTISDLSMPKEYIIK